MVNTGNSDALQLVDFIETIEAAKGKAAIRNLVAMQAGDVPATIKCTVDKGGARELY